MNEKINMLANTLSMKVAGQMDAHLIESIISLFNKGVLVHYVRSPRTELDPKNFKLTVDAANGVRFEGREKIVELEKKIQELEQNQTVLNMHGYAPQQLGEYFRKLSVENEKLKKCVEFYADKNSVGYNTKLARETLMEIRDA